MDVVGRINTLIWADVQSLRSAKKASIFLPYFLFAVLQGIVLTILIFFFIPPFSRVLVPLMLRFYGELALHYPHSYMVLPFLFSGVNRWLLNPLASWLIIGTATLMFAAGYRGQRPRLGRSFGKALRLWVPLFVVGLVEWGVVLGLTQLLRLTATEVLQWGAQAHRLFRVAGFLLNVIFVVPFAFTAAYVVLGNQNIWRALKGSFSLAKSNYGVTFLIIAIPAFFSWAVDFITGKAPQIVFKFSPEIVVLLLILGIVTTLVVNFVIVGALTAFYLHATEGSR